MTLQDAIALMAPLPGVASLESALDKQRRGSVVSLSGLAGSSPAALFSLLKRRKQPALLIADDFEDAGYLYHDLCQIAGPEAVAILPSGYKRSIKYGQQDPAQQILRTEVLNAWKRKETRWVVSYPEALAEKVPDHKKVEQSTLCLATGQTAAISDIRKFLLEQGFNETDYVYEPGQYAIRGSIIDIFSFSYEFPYRIDFFGDEIDSIRSFSVETQLSQQKFDSISIMPPLGADKNPDNISFLDFIDSSTRIFCRNLSGMLAGIKAVCEESISEAVLLSDDGDAEAMENVVEYTAFANRIREFAVAEYSPNIKSGKPDPLNFSCTPQGLYHKNFDIIAESFAQFRKDGYRILILSDSRHQTDRLKSIFEERGDEIEFTPVDKTLHQGFVNHEAKICYFTDHQIFDRFHKYNLRSDRVRSGKLALSLKELNQIEVGDYIVHIDHGIGKFGGLVKTNVNGHMQETIKLIYQNEDILFVSLHSLHKLSKYRGKEGVAPKINRLGGGAWNKLKERTKSKLKDIARDLISLYAKRREEKGFAYSPDSYLQHELEASFIYEDTPDQLKTMEAVKADMESAKPMDRLVCGDVGFGKTEIAIRAAFKAACDNKQTALLVPTTVLAMQHYHTFCERLKDLPVKVDFISRARKPKDVTRILNELAEGKIDILIGTHKIIGKNVRFKDLGLLVIDEEQKFGVAVKEKLKQMKVNVDTLTMSATPIPRTLQFSLMGARDLSSLNTPPANRHPIITNVTAFDDSTISEAVNFEISRNGQVFFISNRIERLADLETRLRLLVPGIRVVMAHGQMPPERLEKAVEDFANHDYDVLLSTTIVENGIDMPNVNTIIVDNAQNFGLSELHQLRGRVGRSSRKAFCYLLTPPGKTLTTLARRRLQAIESFSDLGAGIHIAMQDLDIRGAGNLLGAEQSGFIVDLGYEAYQKILKEAVTELKTEEFADTFADSGQEEEFTSDCLIESDLELLLPATYVPQDSERILLYQQLDNMERPEQVQEFRDSLTDRFGTIPREADELINVVPLRLLAKQLGIERLSLKNGTMYIYFVPATNEAYYMSRAFGKVLAYVQQNVERVKFRQDIEKGKCSIVVDDVKDVFTALNILREIAY